MTGGAQARLLGKWGEGLVADDLRRKGWKVLSMNYRCRFGEIDVIVEKGGILAFVEVKLRKSDRFAPGRVFVTAEKQRKLRLAAEFYLLEHPTRLQPRFDVAEVYAPEGNSTREPVITYLENAFSEKRGMYGHQPV